MIVEKRNPAIPERPESGSTVASWSDEGYDVEIVYERDVRPYPLRDRDVYRVYVNDLHLMGDIVGEIHPDRAEVTVIDAIERAEDHISDARTSWLD